MKEISTVHMAAKVVKGSTVESLYGERPKPVQASEPTLFYREGWLSKSPKVAARHM